MNLSESDEKVKRKPLLVKKARHPRGAIGVCGKNTSSEMFLVCHSCAKEDKQEHSLRWKGSQIYRVRYLSAKIIVLQSRFYP